MKEEVDEFTQCKCGHIYYIGLCECPMCKLDKENEPYGMTQILPGVETEVDQVFKD